MEELIERIKQECAEGYFCPDEIGIEPFGVNQKDSDGIFYLCFPSDKHFSKLNFFLPKPLRALVKDPNNGLTNREKPNQLYIFHYPLNISRIIKEMESIIESNKWYKQQTGKDYDESGDKKFIEDFQKRFNNGSCICPRFTHRNTAILPLLVGQKSILQEAMDYIKQAPENVFDFYVKIKDKRKPTFNADSVRKNTHMLRIYDLLKKPKKVLYNIIN